MSLISKPLHKLLTPQQIKDIPTSKLKHVSFLQRIIPYLCAVKPENYDFNSIKDYLNSNASVYVEDLKDYCESEFIIELYKLLAMYSRSEYFSGKQIEETLYSSATPWVMYAYKSSRGIKYSDWKDPGVLLLGHSFKKLDEAKEKWPNLGSEDLLVARQEALVSKASGRLLNELGYTLGHSTSFPQINPLPTFFKHMLLQTWVFTPSIRNEHMITNPFDFDTPAVPIVDGNIKIMGKEEIEDPW